MNDVTNSTFLFSARRDINEVIDCMMDALTNEQPKADYITDPLSRVLAFLGETLPIFWVDVLVIIGRKLGISV